MTSELFVSFDCKIESLLEENRDLSREKMATRAPSALPLNGTVDLSVRVIRTKRVRNSPWNREVRGGQGLFCAFSGRR